MQLSVTGRNSGGALFEVTVQLLDGKFLYGNEISRINKYGDQPNCIYSREAAIFEEILLLQGVQELRAKGEATKVGI